MFKIMQQGDKKYVTIRIFRKLFQSRLWFHGKILMFTFLFMHSFHAGAFSWEWCLSFFKYSVLCWSAFSIIHVFWVILQGEDAGDIMDAFVDVHCGSITGDIGVLCDLFWTGVWLVLPSTSSLFWLRCKDKLRLFHVVEFVSDKMFCYLPVFRYQAVSIKEK